MVTLWWRVCALVVVALSIGFAAEATLSQELDKADEVELAIAARIDDRERVEFGVVPPGGDASNALLPRARFLSLEQVQATSNWRSSSPVEVSLHGMNPDQVTVRVVARGGQDGGVEFSLQAMGEDGNWGPRLLPAQRYLPLTVPLARWFRSSAVTLDFSPPPPEIDEIHCTPGAPRAGDELTCTASITGSVSDYAWSAGSGRDSGDTSRFSTTFPTAGQWTVQLVVTGPEGTGSKTLILHVRSPLPPVVEGIECRPALVIILQSVSCRAQVLGIADAFAWNTENNVDVSSTDPFVAKFREVGATRISLVASGPGGDSEEFVTSLQVVGPPRIDQVDCLPKAPEIGETVTCTASVSGPDLRYEWSAGGSPSVRSEPVFETSFSEVGGQVVTLRIVGPSGDDSSFDSVSVDRPGPQIERISCVVSPVDRGGHLTSDEDEANNSMSAPAHDIYSCAAEVDERAGRVAESAWWTNRVPANEYQRGLDGVREFRIFRNAAAVAIVFTVRGANGSIDTAMWVDRKETLDENRAKWTAVWCAPVLPARGEVLSCGRLGSPEYLEPPISLWWRVDAGHPDVSVTSTFRTYFTTSGHREVYSGFSVRDAHGAGRIAIWIADRGPTKGPAIDSVVCETPGSSPNDLFLICRATVSGGQIDSYMWRIWGSHDLDLIWRDGQTLTVRRYSDGPRGYILVVKGPEGSDAYEVSIPGKAPPQP